MAAGQFDKLHLPGTMAFIVTGKGSWAARGATEGLTRLMTMLVPWRAPLQYQESMMSVPPVQSEFGLRKKHVLAVWIAKEAHQDNNDEGAGAAHRIVAANKLEMPLGEDEVSSEEKAPATNFSPIAQTLGDSGPHRFFSTFRFQPLPAGISRILPQGQGHSMRLTLNLPTARPSLARGPRHFKSPTTPDASTHPDTLKTTSDPSPARFSPSSHSGHLAVATRCLAINAVKLRGRRTTTSTSTRAESTGSMPLFTTLIISFPDFQEKDGRGVPVQLTARIPARLWDLLP
ncbi:hypothetical protein BDP55DRAFT_758935 [Colletotrichum godetiae]|uniref:Uncharacterized protein n=1 Tax=Colletotrichum godetiae TaxID=1209918 RepID=A0AAJ0ERA3_9PEZI|nr:uncharacterized protein BDP55DRAFT_758935 [Colletotrichum godetiae]KAK1658293.1 hypothetical protein BDP55DRAFT_758935 [Colletotrichum godetiae]